MRKPTKPHTILLLMFLSVLPAQAPFAHAAEAAGSAGVKTPAMFCKVGGVPGTPGLVTPAITNAVIKAPWVFKEIQDEWRAYVKVSGASKVTMEDAKCESARTEAEIISNRDWWINVDQIERYPRTAPLPEINFQLGARLKMREKNPLLGICAARSGEITRPFTLNSEDVLAVEAAWTKQTDGSCIFKRDSESGLTLRSPADPKLVRVMAVEYIKYFTEDSQVQRTLVNFQPVGSMKYVVGVDMPSTIAKTKSDSEIYLVVTDGGKKPTPLAPARVQPTAEALAAMRDSQTAAAALAARNAEIDRKRQAEDRAYEATCKRLPSGKCFPRGTRQ